MLSPGKLTLEVSLDKEQYFHGETIKAVVSLSNHSKKIVRSIKVSVIQHTEVTLVAGHYSKSVASIETREGCPISSGISFSKAFNLIPSASTNKDRRGIALDGMLKVDFLFEEIGIDILTFLLQLLLQQETDSKLASSTINTNSDSIGILISYVVRARLYLGAIGGDITCDVPFTLNNMEPGSETDQAADSIVHNQQLLKQKQSIIAGQRRLRKQMTREMSADIVFEDFARRRQESAEICSKSFEEKDND